jgi:ketosteroid isomerase-like protein
MSRPSAGESNVAVVEAAFAHYLAGDRAAAEPLYAPDFAFTSPQDDRIDKKTFLDRCFPTASRLNSQRLLRVVATSDELVLAYYEYELTDRSTFRNMEAITVRAGLISEVQVFFGGEQALTGTSRDASGVEVGRAPDRDVARVLAGYTAYAAGDFDAAVAWLHPAVEWIEPVEFPNGGRRRGPAAVREYLQGSRQGWRELRSRPIAHRRGELIVVVHDVSGVRVDGTPHRARVADVFTMTDGLVTRMQAYADPAEALG